MRVETLVSGGFEENTYLLSDGKDAYVIDPGIDASAIHSVIYNLHSTLKYVLLTHGHYDHIIGAQALNAPIYAHEGEKALIESGTVNLSAYITGKEISLKSVNYIKGVKAEMGGFEFYHTPGHTAGSMVIKAGDALFTGDTLFYDTVGRTDVPTGDSRLLRASLKVFDGFDKGLTCYPGHGEPFKLGDAFKVNYFLKKNF